VALSKLSARRRKVLAVTFRLFIIVIGVQLQLYGRIDLQLFRAWSGVLKSCSVQFGIVASQRMSTNSTQQASSVRFVWVQYGDMHSAKPTWKRAMTIFRALTLCFMLKSNWSDIDNHSKLLLDSRKEAAITTGASNVHETKRKNYRPNLQFVSVQRISQFRRLRPGKHVLNLFACVGWCVFYYRVPNFDHSRRLDDFYPYRRSLWYEDTNFAIIFISIKYEEDSNCTMKT
jgi:hypothetical protein